MANITNSSPVVTEDKLKDFYEDIKPFLGCPAYVTQEGGAEYYSTDEKVIGRWIDNKPLYQKSYIIPNITFTNDIDLGLSTAIIYLLDGVLIGTINGYNYPLNYQHPEYQNMYSVATSITPGNKLSMRAVSDFKSLDTFTVYVTVRYTKTTDSAVTTIEQKPTHYSTDEQVVGTWIDGKPIYQKTFTYTGPDITMDTTSRVLEIANISTLNIDKIIKQIEGEARWGSSRNPIPLSYYAPDLTVFADFLYDRAHGLLVLRYYRSSGTMVIGDIVATITYTKTTD